MMGPVTVRQVSRDSAFRPHITLTRRRLLARQAEQLRRAGVGEAQLAQDLARGRVVDEVAGGEDLCS